MDIKAMRAEYSRLRSIAMKRIKRAKEAGFADMPNIMGAQFLLPSLRDIPKTDIEQVDAALVNAQSFLVKPTRLPQLRVEAKRLEEEAMRLYGEIFDLRKGQGRDFMQFYQEANARVLDKIEYVLSVKSIYTSRQEEVIAEVKRAFGEWLRSRL